MKSILLSTFMAGALSSELRLMSSQTKNLRASYDGKQIEFDLGIDEVTSDLRIEVLDKDFIVRVGAQSNFMGGVNPGSAGRPGSMDQSSDAWAWVGGIAGAPNTRTAGLLKNQNFTLLYTSAPYENATFERYQCDVEGKICSFRIDSRVSGGNTLEDIYTAACQKYGAENRMTCSIQQINKGQGQDLVNKVKFATYFPMEVFMKNATSKTCEKKCVDGYGKMSEGFEENTDNNQPDNVHTAYQVVQDADYCHFYNNDHDDHSEGNHVSSYITYSVKCPRQPTLGSTCDICA